MQQQNIVALTLDAARQSNHITAALNHNSDNSPQCLLKQKHMFKLHSNNVGVPVFSGDL